jgi:hypothetical protein
MTGLRRWVTANRLQVAVTVVLALFLAAATWSSSKATGYWQQAAREDARSATARIESVRFVYQSELPLALGLGQAQVQRDALRALDAEDELEVAGEGAAADRLVAQLQMNADKTRNGLVHGDDYVMPGGRYDVARRLGDVLNADRVASLDTSAATMRAGDRWARWARGWVILSLTVAVAYVVLSGFRGRRRRADPARAAVGLIPTPWDEPGRRRLVAMTALAAWLALPVLTAEQLALSTGSTRAAAESSRLISQVSGAATVSQIRSGAAGGLQLQGIDLATRGLVRQYTATLNGSHGQELLGIAEQRAGERWGEVSKEMVALPRTGEGVDPITIAWLASEPSDWEHVRSQQERVQLASERDGSHSDAVALALLIAALAATAATVARLPGALRRSASVLAACLLGLATLLAAGAALA